MEEEFDRLLGERRFAEAERVAREGASECAVTDGPQSLSVARHLARIAFVCEELSRFEEAEKQYEQALAIREKVLGPTHPDITTNLVNLGRLLTKRGKLDRAVDLLRRSIAIQVHLDNPDDQFFLSSVSDLIEALTVAAKELGEGRGVAPAAAKAFTLCEESCDGDDKLVARLLQQVGEVCRQRHQVTEAEHFLERALAIRERLYGPYDSTTLFTAGSLAAAYNDQGQHRRAETLLERIVHAAAQYDVDPNVLCMALNNLAYLYEKRGTPGLALTLYRRTHYLFAQLHGALHPHSRYLERRIASLERSSHPITLNVLCQVGIATFLMWLVSLCVVINVFGGGTEMWPAFAAAVPAVGAGAFVLRYLLR